MRVSPDEICTHGDEDHGAENAIRCKCFIGDATRLIMPAFGSFTGGRSISAEPLIALFPSGEYAVWMLGSRAVHRFPAKRVC